MVLKFRESDWVFINEDSITAKEHCPTWAGYKRQIKLIREDYDFPYGFEGGQGRDGYWWFKEHELSPISKISENLPDSDESWF